MDGYEIGFDNVRVWSIELNIDRDRLARLRSYLNPAERARADKFIDPAHGDRWSAARGYLRQILSTYLDLAPDRIVFTLGAQGKPKVVGTPIEFNISHSRDRAIYGVSTKYPLGIDLEFMRPIVAADLVDRFFAKREQEQFHALPVEIQQQAFYHAWVQKEAYLKACGTGLSTPLDKIEVSIDPRTPTAIVSAPIAGNWQIQNLEIAANYASAIVVGGDV
jgi:4'-phosphopantetheinyl transferase